MFQQPPTVSIITVTYNSAHLLEGTIRSVLNQTYPNLEYVIVDGASTDYTELIIRLAESSNQRLLNSKKFRYLREPDRGLYDAMNKGLKLASGEFVLFLNAGDQLFETQTIEKMMLQCTPDTDVLFGEVMMVSPTRYQLGTRSERTAQKLPESLTWKSLRYGMVVSHQAFLARRTLAPFYLENNLAADIDWVIGILKKSRTIRHTHLIVSEYLVGGLSKQKHGRSLLDRFRILQKHYGFIPNLLAHLIILLRAGMRTLFF